MNYIPCNCGHSREDHSAYWCIFSEYGLCPCDHWIPMTNLEFLEYKYVQQ